MGSQWGHNGDNGEQVIAEKSRGQRDKLISILTYGQGRLGRYGLPDSGNCNNRNSDELQEIQQKKMVGISLTEFRVAR